MLTALSNNSSSLQPAPLSPLQSRQIFLQSYLGWYHAINAFGFILVVAIIPCIACIVLWHLFSIILDNALTIWANNPPSNQVVLEAGNLRIEFGCTKEPVPMEFIAEFAESHRDAVERGFAPVFVRELWWERRGGGRKFYAGLRFVEEGGVAIPPLN